MLEKQTNENTKNIQILQNKVDNLGSQVDNNTKNIQTSQNKVDNLSSQVDNNTRNIQTLHNKVDNLGTQVTNNTESINNLEKLVQISSINTAKILEVQIETKEILQNNLKLNNIQHEEFDCRIENLEKNRKVI